MFEKLEEIRDRYHELQEAILQPDTACDFSRYQSCMKEISAIRPVAEEYEAYIGIIRQIQDAKGLLSDPDYSSEAEAEIAALEEAKNRKIDQLRLLLVPPDPLNSRNVILEIRAGVGGEEAALFAADLMRMYSKYADKNGLFIELLSVSPTDLGGISEALMMVTGSEPFAKMKFESGTHCVKRVPVTESGGRIHTSTATVAVLPEAKDVEVEINPSDIRVDVFHASGHGGQGVNTTDSAVRLTHIPTGQVVVCQDERSQLENKNKAMKVLRSRLAEKERIRQEAAVAAERSQQIKNGDRSDRIRTYYFNHDYVVDHRIGMTINRTAEVLNGELSPFIEALQLAEKTDRLSGLSSGK